MECPICLEEITDSHNQTRVHCCKGLFHTECYLKCSNPCPLCRSQSFIVTEQPRPVPPIILVEHRSVFSRTILVNVVIFFGITATFWFLK